MGPYGPTGGSGSLEGWTLSRTYITPDFRRLRMRTPKRARRWSWLQPYPERRLFGQGLARRCHLVGQFRTPHPPPASLIPLSPTRGEGELEKRVTWGTPP